MHIIDKSSITLKQTSYDDDNKLYMVNSNLTVCSFDAVKEWYIQTKIPHANPNPKSNDALYFGKEDCFFIEFKNGKICNSVNFELNKKIYDSLFILFDLQYCDKNGKPINSITYTRKHMNYILVYNEQKYLDSGETRQTKEGFQRQAKEKSESMHRNELYKNIRKLAHEEFVLYGLDQFKNYLFKNVYTYTVDEFEKNFINMQSISN